MPVLYIRVDDPEQHERIKRAASISGTSLNKFCLDAVLADADVIANEWETTHAKTKPQTSSNFDPGGMICGEDGA